MKEYTKISPFVLYKEAYSQYSEIVKDLQIDNGEKYSNLEKINSFNNIFMVAEAVIKQILHDNNIKVDNICEEERNFTGLCSLLLEKLSDKLPACKKIDFKILCSEKMKRNKGEHKLNIYKLNTAVRCWNNVKKLLLILDDSENLPDFEYIRLETVDIQKILFDTESFANNDVNYVLVVDSIHDLNEEFLYLLANIRWSLVIDFDAYTDEGGLRSYCSKGIFKREYKVNLLDTTINDNKCIWIKMGDDLKESKIDFKEFESFIDQFYSAVENEVIVVSLTQKQQHLNFIRSIANKYVSNKMIRIFFPCCLNDFEVGKVDELMEEYDVYWNYNRYWLQQIMKELVKYKDDLISDEEQEEKIYLPGKDELDNDIQISIDNNTKFNLEDYFEIVYIGCETKEKDATQEIINFYNGEKASWQVFKNERYVTLIEEDIYKEFKNEILKSLGHLPINRDTVIFKIKHEAGFGGTTVSRQIAWDLHFKHPILIVKKYKYGKITDLISNLYDNIVRKGILIIADENNITLDEIERLENEIKRLDRRVALLIVQRERKIANISNKRFACNTRTINLYHYNSNTIDKLKNAFKSITVLSEDEIKKRENMLQELKRNSSNINFECPFIIGLYYLQENFTGIDEFVKKSIRVLEQNNEDIDILNYIAFADLYGKRELPFSLITIYYKKSSQSENTISRIANEKMKKYSDLIIKDKNGSYRFKHYLLSYKFLDIFLGKSGKENSHIGYLKEISIKFIDLTIQSFNDVLPTSVQEILKQIYIKNKIEDIEDDDAKTFSQLINSVINRTDKEDILLYLKEKYHKLIEKIYIDYELNRDDIKFQNYLFLAHVWGHLARFYFKIENNYSKAKECCEQAVRIMDKVKIDDYIIRHIYGDCYAREFIREITENKHLDTYNYMKYIQLLERGCEQYQASVKNGNVQYGVLSEIQLLISLMIEVYEQKNILSTNDYCKLNLEERQYKNRIEDLFDLVTDDDLDFDAKRKYNNLWRKFCDRIQFRNYSDSIQFHQNEYDVVRSQNFDLEELDCRRSELIHAILSQYRDKYIRRTNSTNNVSDYYMNTVENKKHKDDCDRVLDLLKEGIYSPDYSKNTKVIDRKTFYFKTWFKIVKFSDKNINEAIEIAHMWFDLEKERKFKSPSPAYYLYVLYFLRGLQDNDCLEESNKYRKLCYQQCKHYKMFEDGVVSTAKFRDYLCIGNKMNQLFNAHLIDEPKYYNEINNIASFKGKFSKIEKNGIGEVLIIEPRAVKNQIVYFRPKECGLGEGQLGNTLQFSLGFTFERIEAINKSVYDLTNNKSEIIVKSENARGFSKLQNVNINKNYKLQYVSLEDAIKKNIIVEDSKKIMGLEIGKYYRAVIKGNSYDINDGFKYPHLIAIVEYRHGKDTVNIPYNEIATTHISNDQVKELKNKEVIVKVIKNSNPRNINASILSVVNDFK